MLNVKYDFSSVHVTLPAPLSEEIMEWGRINVSDDEIFVQQKDPYYGREDEIHITVLYGIHADKPQQVMNLIEGFGLLQVRLGDIEVFTAPPKFDVVVIQAISEDLNLLNSLLKSKIPHSEKHPVYLPHVTIAYVKKGKGWHHRGLDLWKGKEFLCDFAVFSSKDGSKERIPL